MPHHMPRTICDALRALRHINKGVSLLSLASCINPHPRLVNVLFLS